MHKVVKYGTQGALIGGLGNMFFNLIKQLWRISADDSLRFNWKEFWTAGFKGALVGGTAGALIGGIKDIKNANEEPLNTSSILSSAVMDLKLNKKDPVYKRLSRKADNIVALLEAKFKDQLGGHIIRIGSTEDNTALSKNFDIDISVPFAARSFSSIPVMYDELLSFFEGEYLDSDLLNVRVQKKSVGLIYDIDGKEAKIDVVPYKLSQDRKNSTTGYLIVNSNSAFLADSYTKTNIASLKSIKLTAIQQKLLIVFKSWKRNYSVPISSHLLRSLIIRSYLQNKGRIPRSFTDKILMIVSFIEENIMERRIVSVENTNNVLTDISNSKKVAIRRACEKIMDDYKYQPNSILDYFDK